MTGLAVLGPILPPPGSGDCPRWGMPCNCCLSCRRDCLLDAKAQVLHTGLTKKAPHDRASSIAGRPCRSESACRRSLQPLSPIQNNSDLAQGLFQFAPLKSGVARSIWRQEGYMAPIPKPARFEFTVGMVLAMALTILVVMTWAVAAP